MSEYQENEKYSYNVEPPTQPYHAYSPYNGYYAQQNAAQAMEKEHKKFKKTMYRLMAGMCVLALIVGVAGGGVAGYLLADRGGQTLATTGAAMENPTETPSATTTVPPKFLASVSDGDARPVQEIYANNVDAVVSIYVETTVNSGYYYYGQAQSYTQEGAGSGVIISPDGYIATNNHVIAGADKIRVCLQDGTEYEAVLVGTDDDTDVALIKIDAQNLTAATVGDSDTLYVGDQAIVIGNPLGRLSGTLTVGYVSALNRPLEMDSTTGQTMNVIQIDAAVNPGNSGGALFNAKGELVGIIFAKTADTDVEGLGYAIPINHALDVINDLVEFGYVKGRPALGISVVAISTPMEAMMYRVNYLGVYIANSTNADADFRSGDLIVSVDDTEIGDYASLASAISSLKIGDTATVVVMRGGEKITLSVPVVENVPTDAAAE